MYKGMHSAPVSVTAPYQSREQRRGAQRCSIAATKPMTRLLADCTTPWPANKRRSSTEGLLSDRLSFKTLPQQKHSDRGRCPAEQHLQPNGAFKHVLGTAGNELFVRASSCLCFQLALCCFASAVTGSIAICVLSQS